MHAETSSLVERQPFPLSRIVLTACGAFGLVMAVTMALPTPSSSSLYTSTATSRSSVAALAPVTALSRQRAETTPSVALMAAEEPSLAEAPEVATRGLSPVLVGAVAAVSTLVGAVAMKLWSHETDATVDASIDVEAVPAAGAPPMTFRTSAPWMSSAAADRGGRLVLQAAKGKGKGGGAKGKIAGIIKLALPAGKATPAPPVGPALGQYGLNIVAFCKEYNAATEKDAADGMIIPVEITAFEDRSYTFVLKTPPASVLLRKAAGVPKGSSTPNKDMVGSITTAQLEEIAKTKLPDLNTADVKQAMKIVAGTANSMGITINP